jgi:hypothetical protein
MSRVVSLAGEAALVIVDCLRDFLFVSVNMIVSPFGA